MMSYRIARLRRAFGLSPSMAEALALLVYGEPEQ